MAEDIFSNKQVARLLRNIATAYTLVGDSTSKDGKVSRFRIIAYEKAADAIEHLSTEIYDIWKSGKIYDVPGIGKAIGSALEQYFKNGKSEHFDQILKFIPSSVFRLMDVPGIGPKKAFKIVTHFNLLDEEKILDDVIRIAESGRIAFLESFGQKSEADILAAIKLFKSKDRLDQRMPLPEATNIANKVVLWMKKIPGIERIDVLGSLRRKVATIGDIDIAIATGSDPSEIITHFLNFPEVRSVEASGKAKASVLISSNIRIDLRVQDIKSYGSMLQYFTGSKAHNIRLREHALKKGYSLSEHGLRRISNVNADKITFDKEANSTKSINGIKNRELQSNKEDKEKDMSDIQKTVNSDDINMIQFANERALYEFLGLSYIPPELREDRGEVELAKLHKLPKLVNLQDIKSDLHIHSSYQIQTSHDMGESSYENLTLYAINKNYKYIGFSDHNPIITGLNNKDIISILKARKEYIDQKIKPLGLPYFIGLEVDIRPDGELALPEGGEKYLDYIIASIHSSFNQPQEEMTERIIRALRQPKVKILGHPVGRIIGERDGVKADWFRIFKEIKKNNQAIEINSYPYRLDLPDDLIFEANKYNLLFSINTDAHKASQLDLMEFGVSQARRGFVSAPRVINTWSYDKFVTWL